MNGWCDQQDRENRFLALYFDQSWLADHFELPRSKQELTTKLYFNDSDLLATLEKIVRLLRAPDPAPRLQLDTLLMLAGAELYALGEPKRALRSGGHARPQIARAVEYIEANSTKNIALDEVAAIAGLSQFHFCRAFKQAIGQTPHQFALQSRINHAKRMLEQKSTPIAEVAAAAGFKSFSHFSRTFARIAGEPPSAYLRRRRT